MSCASPCASCASRRLRPWGGRLVPLRMAWTLRVDRGWWRVVRGGLRVGFLGMIRVLLWWVLLFE